MKKISLTATHLKKQKLAGSCGEGERAEKLVKIYIVSLKPLIWRWKNGVKYIRLK